MFALLKLILISFYDEPKLPLIPKVGPSAEIKKILWLSAWDDELLSTPKIIAFLAVLLSKLLKLALSNQGSV